MFLPEGYDEYILCSEIYHCTPTELDEQPSLTVQRDLAIWNGIKKVESYQRKAAAQKK